MRLIACLAAAALVVGSPVFTDSIGLTDVSAAHAKGNGNGGGGGGGGGNGGDRGKSNDNRGGAKAGGNSGGAKANRGGGGGTLKKLFGIDRKTERGKPAAKSGGGKPVKSTGAKSGAAKPKVQKAAAPATSKRPELPKSRPIQADLKGLNSLKRNINGVMNSSDPKMAGFRDFIQSSADLVTAQETLLAAQEKYDPLATDYATLLEPLGLTVPETEEGYDSLKEALEAAATAPAPNEADYLNPDGTLDQVAYDKAVTDWGMDKLAAEEALADYDAVRDAWGEVDTADKDVATAEEGSSEEAMIQAIVDGMNATGAGPITEEDVTPEMADWVSNELGVGEADGLIDDYIAQSQTEDMAAVEVVEGEEIPGDDADDGEDDEEDDGEDGPLEN